MKYSFRNDYSEGAHPQVLQALTDTNTLQTCGYGLDDFCTQAAAQIRARVTHDAAKNTAQMIEIYRKVLQREGTL